jgi:hypothetical protein
VNSLGILRPLFGVRKVAFAPALIVGLLICQTALAADAARFEAESMGSGSFASVVPDASAFVGAWVNNNLLTPNVHNLSHPERINS